MRSRKSQTAGPRSLARLLGLFEVLAKSSNGQTLAELNTVLKSPKSSLLNLLRPLVAEGYLTYEDGRYRLGTSIFRLAASIVSVWNFSNALRPYLEELAERSHESVYIAVLDPVRKTVTYVDAIDSRHPVRFSVPIGATGPLYCTAAGRVLLTLASEKFQEKYLRAVRLEARTPQTITAPKALRAELDKVRESGVAVSLGESVPGAAAIAAPVFGAHGTVTAAIVIGGPVERLQRELPTLRPIITDVARRASGFNSRAILAEVAPLK
ncbi:MAG: IclR family transcriptional regulator [Gammaproteobacteria bacterium]|nr:MAG: IclR family transcriptional regulator [Gammaproteobacteria bacterium]